MPTPEEEEPVPMVTSCPWWRPRWASRPQGGRGDRHAFPSSRNLGGFKIGKARVIASVGSDGKAFGGGRVWAGVP